ncbi:MAG TPA: hypothetical protein VN193_17310 [Candidatus Angelobacter sp.]|jgi:hypothetical protein|nr:hypothetical protein [Candidatus Angelobacter sp.]
MSNQNAFHNQLHPSVISAADESEAHVLRRFHRWQDFVRAVRDAARRDDFSARLDLALQRSRR